jgi:hypothetical protein
MKRLLAGIVLLALVLGGCAGRESRLVGAWRGSIELMEAEAQSPAESFAEATAHTFSLDLKADRTFRANMLVPLDGKWRLDGESLVLEPIAFMGLAAGDGASGRPIELRIAADNKSLRLSNRNMAGGEFVFVRASE